MPKRKIEIDPNLCTHVKGLRIICIQFLGVCPVEAIYEGGDGKLEIDRSLCRNGKCDYDCANVCPEDAIRER